MDSVNRIEIRGRIVEDPDFKTINGKQCINMKVVTEYIYHGKNGAQIEETYHRVTAWQGLKVKDIHKMKRGDFVRVIGRYRQRSYDGPDGNRMSVYEIIANQTSILK